MLSWVEIVSPLRKEMEMMGRGGGEGVEKREVLRKRREGGAIRALRQKAA